MFNVYQEYDKKKDLYLFHVDMRNAPNEFKTWLTSKYLKVNSTGSIQHFIFNNAEDKVEFFLKYHEYIRDAVFVSICVNKFGYYVSPGIVEYELQMTLSDIVREEIDNEILKSLTK